jgi:hypothetical protein
MELAMQGVTTQKVAEYIGVAIQDLRTVDLESPMGDNIATMWSIFELPCLDSSQARRAPREKKVVGLTWKGRQALNRCIAEILKNSRIRAGLSADDIEHSLRDLLIEFGPNAVLDGTRLESQVAKLLNQLEQRLGDLTELTVAAPVFGLSWDGPEFPGFNIGNVQFTTHDAVILRWTSSGKSYPRALSDQGKDCPWLTASVRASAPRAIERCFTMMKEALSVVALYLAERGGTDVPKLDVSAIATRRQGPALVFPSGDTDQQTVYMVRGEEVWIDGALALIGEEFLEWLSSGNRPVLSRILHLPNDERGELGTRIVTSLEWFAIGAQSATSAQAYISWMTAVEALLGHQQDIRRGGVCASLQERAAFLLGKRARGGANGGEDIRTRMRISERMGRLYTLRNRLVHGQMQEAQPERLREMLFMLLDVIDAVVDKCAGLQEFDDLLREIDVQKFSVDDRAVKQLRKPGDAPGVPERS